MTGPTYRGILHRLNEEHASCGQTCTLEDYSSTCPRLLLVPLIETLDVPGRREVPVVGFATFLLDHSSVNYAGHHVVGRFVTKTTVPGLPGEGKSLGVYTFALVD